MLHKVATVVMVGLLMPLSTMAAVSFDFQGLDFLCDDAVFSRYLDDSALASPMLEPPSGINDVAVVEKTSVVGSLTATAPLVVEPAVLDLPDDGCPLDGNDFGGGEIDGKDCGQPVPVPAAAFLGMIGLGTVGWLKRRGV